MPSKNEAIVVGCSACGALAARDLARAGVKTIVLEEHSRAGKQGKCSGLVSKRGLSLLGVADATLERSVVNEVRGAHLHSKSGALLSVERRSSVACVLDRQRFDEALARQAKADGARVLLKHRATAVKQSPDGVTVYCGAGGSKRECFDSSFVIAADGAASRCAASLGFPKISKFVLGYEAEFEGARVDSPDFVELFFDARAFPGFFAWLIPAGERRVRAGFATRDLAAFAYSKNAFHRLPAIEALVRSPRTKRVREYTHVIPAAIRPKTQTEKVLLVGDAAGQVKATTGGGIVFGGLCGRQAARSIAAAIESGEPLDYERAWRRKFGSSLKLHSLIRDGLNCFGNAGVNALIGIGERARLEWFLREFGDMDFVFR